MINKPLHAVDATDLNGLVANGVGEGRTIEYKLTLPGGTDSDRKEFLADVSSFANAGGGDIIYGVAATDGVPTAIPGLAGFNDDKDKLRLESSIRDGIESRIPGVHLHVVPGFADGPVLVIRVPRSWAGPHMVAYKGTSRFYSRTSAGKFQMDVSEIRSAFDGAGQLPKRIAAWRDERLGRIVANEGPFRTSGNGCLVVHLVPLASFDSNQFEIGDLNSPNRHFCPIGTSGWDTRVNADGIVSYRRMGDSALEASTFTQIFRSGSVEAVSDRLLSARDGTKFIPCVWYEQETIKAVSSYLGAMQGLGVEPPILFMLSMTGVRGAVMYVEHSFGEFHPIDRDVLVIPDVLIDDLASDVTKALKPAFDMVWNACGYVRSYNYNDKGEWAPRR